MDRAGRTVATAASARAFTSVTAVRLDIRHPCTIRCCLIFTPPLVLVIVFCTFFLIAIEVLYPNIPSHPEFNVTSATAANKADELRLGVLVSNPNGNRTLSFTNVTLAATLPFGGGCATLQHPPFQVAGNQDAMLWFRFENATNSSSGGAPLISLELNTNVWSGGGVKFPATSGEISMTSRCDPVTITYNIDEEVMEARGCERRSRDQWDKDVRRFTRVLIIVGVVCGVPFLFWYFLIVRMFLQHQQNME